MYKTVDTYLAKNDINSALGECIRGNFYHLGLLLGRIRKKDDGQFYDLMQQLYSHTVGSTKDGIIIQEEVPESTVEKIVVPTTESKIVVPKKVPEIIAETDPIKLIIQEESETKVKLLCNWQTSEQLANLWNKMSQGHYKWGNIHIVWDEESPDYWVIINCPPINELPPPNKTILFQMEPNMALHSELWGDWANPPPEHFVKVCTHAEEYNNVEWHLSKTYNELKTEKIVKDSSLDDVLSTVLSAKYHDPGQIKRIDFVKFLEKKGLSVHVFGDNKWSYKEYKGSLPYHQKDEALLPYKYTFNVENNSIKNYFSEKITDGILAECLTFYSGCFNLKEYFPEDAFVYLELSNFEKDYEIIKKAIEEDWWSQRISAIRESKRILLEELQFFPRLERIIKEHESKKECRK